MNSKQMQNMQRQFEAEAAQRGIGVHEYVDQLKREVLHRHQEKVNADASMKAKASKIPPSSSPNSGDPHSNYSSQSAQAETIPISEDGPKLEALAMANFLLSQNLKVRTCIFQEKRKDMFRVKRALRAIQSPAYEKARSKNPLLPPVTDRSSAERAFLLLPASLLALRVTKVEPSDNNGHGKKKRVKGLWTVTINPQQDSSDDSHYMWLYVGSQWKQKLYAGLALILVFVVVMFPLWPLMLRQAVWYASMGLLGLIGLFFIMAIFRLFLFVITTFLAPPGLWLYPRLFEDVGFFDSFRPVWAWHETAADLKAKRKAKRDKRLRKEKQSVNPPQK